MTTNFDLLLEDAALRHLQRVQTYALGSIPRPTERPAFAGVLHIHGALTRDPARFSDLILTDQDFGEFYLRRRVVPDLLYDSARLYHLVFVGYRASDPPMRYLLNVIAADEERFDDLKDRFIFVGSDRLDPVALADWRARGIHPIHYHAPKEDHSVLCRTLVRWAELSAINGKRHTVEREIRRIVKTPRSDATDADRELFDHFFRRSNSADRVDLARVASGAKAGPDWLDAILTSGTDRDRNRWP